jgi:hypothetical protein
VIGVQVNGVALREGDSQPRRKSRAHAADRVEHRSSGKDLGHPKWVVGSRQFRQLRTQTDEKPLTQGNLSLCVPGPRKDPPLRRRYDGMITTLRRAESDDVRGSSAAMPALVAGSRLHGGQRRKQPRVSIT